LIQTTNKHEIISANLIAAYPSQKDLDYLCEIGGDILVYFQTLIKKTTHLPARNWVNDKSAFTKIPNLRTHPVIITKRLLTIAIFVQHLTREEARGLSESAPVLIKRLGDAARLVSTNDDLVGTLEGLECVMLEGTFQANCGNLRKAWLAVRRAISIAQLMGIDRQANVTLPKPIDPSTIINSQSIWFQLVYVDHFLCLLLGFQQGSDYHTLSDDVSWNDDHQSAKLKRMHVAIAARILQRNHDFNSQHTEHLEVTKVLDAELLEAAKSMPTDFWRRPNFTGLARHSVQAISEAIRLTDQIFHYSLLIQLHLPYLLHFNGRGRCEYSNVACVNASREVLTRFLTFRTFNRVASACRFSDFLSLMAAMTLLLAHLESHRNQIPFSIRILAHQRLGDRAMMEQVLENMDIISKLNDDDVLMDKSASLLRQLLDIEAEAADGHTYCAEKVSDDHQENDGHVLMLSVPYFGTIRFARDGIARTGEEPRLDPLHLQSLHGDGISLSSTAMSSPAGHELAPNLNPNTQPCSIPSVYQEANIPSNYPGFAADLGDWAFQGVDGAFFDNLMKGQVPYNLVDVIGEINFF
jgi:hypothetical protein